MAVSQHGGISTNSLIPMADDVVLARGTVKKHERLRLEIAHLFVFKNVAHQHAGICAVGIGSRM